MDFLKKKGLSQSNFKSVWTNFIWLNQHSTEKSMELKSFILPEDPAFYINLLSLRK